MAVVWKKLAYEDDVITKALLTTTGDVIYASAASTPARLGIGTSGYVLTAGATIPAWAAPTVGSHALSNHTVAVANVPFGGFEATDLALQNSATPPVTPVLGKIYFDTDLSAYICTSIA